jgi:hypothetical protein
MVLNSLRAFMATRSTPTNTRVGTTIEIANIVGSEVNPASAFPIAPIEPLQYVQI